MTDTTPAVSADDAANIASASEHEARKVAAIARLAFAREQHPELVKKEAEARLELTAAIMAMDEAYQTPGKHDLFEQMHVERAKNAYAQALADLVRGEESRNDV